MVGCRMWVLQAVLTNSFFVSQWERPVAVQEYLLPAADTLGFPDVRACLSAPGNESAATVVWYRPQYFNKKKMMGAHRAITGMLLHLRCACCSPARKKHTFGAHDVLEKQMRLV